MRWGKYSCRLFTCEWVGLYLLRQPENGKEFLENTCRMRMRGRARSSEWVWGLVWVRRWMRCEKGCSHKLFPRSKRYTASGLVTLVSKFKFQYLFTSRGVTRRGAHSAALYIARHSPRWHPRYDGSLCARKGPWCATQRNAFRACRCVLGAAWRARITPQPQSGGGRVQIALDNLCLQPLESLVPPYSLVISHGVLASPHVTWRQGLQARDSSTPGFRPVWCSLACQAHHTFQGRVTAEGCPCRPVLSQGTENMLQSVRN